MLLFNTFHGEFPTDVPFDIDRHRMSRYEYAVTLVDRLLHRAEIIEIQGESYRLKEAKERATTKSASRSKKRD